MTEKILLTGATGFLGTALCSTLGQQCEAVRAVRIASKESYSDIVVGDINADTDWSEALAGVCIIIHCAARAHIMRDDVANSLDEYRKVNVLGTLKLAQQAADSGAKRFIFISSIKVNGESTTGTLPFNECNNCNPSDPYAISKFEAEQGLLEIAKKTGMEVVIIRPPLIYGPGVKANFQSLMKLANSAIPLPFGSISNVRSMVYIGNLVDFIVKAIDDPAAADQVFIISDGEDISLSALICLMRKSIGRSRRLFSVPEFIFKWMGALTAKKALVERLIGSLQVDSSKASALLSWKPPYSLAQGVEITMKEFVKGINKSAKNI